MSSACLRFIGVDGTNPTLNTGRFLINLKPPDQRRASASDVIRRLERDTPRRCRHRALHAAGAGSDDRRSGQPLRNTISCSRTPTRASSRSGSRNCSSACSSFRRSKGSTSNYAENGLSAYILIDRPTAARFGITRAPSTTRSMIRSGSASSRRSSPSRTNTG